MAKIISSHVHSYVKYTRNRYNRDDLFKCNDPHCTHFADRAFVMGKASLCPACGREFILDREALRRVRPTCLNCSNTKEGRKHRALQSLITGILEGDKTDITDGLL